MSRTVLILSLVALLSACFSNESDELNALYNDDDVQMDKLIQGVDHIEFLYKQQRGGQQVHSVGRIIKILKNQDKPFAAQQILLRLSSGRKLIIKHNIEAGQAVPDLKIGESLEFYGVYRWNYKGGLIIGTHLLADESKKSGWLKFNDLTYQ
ncbi:DUF3465 domain-containing protein [Psychromonas ossibalaenae]|uniref:DUF3465 domain-containing protein n=1 Tax=Psychromonas ossibalaenae TaxID=444922 RepID=UPI00037D7834|nr:DUF3465 domain-containing protein [Psychromonas ossibalaenae]